MLHLTRPLLRATYEYLRETKPFVDWNLPEGDDVAFRVMKNKKLLGLFQVWDDEPNLRIKISEYTVGHTVTLMATMAHEMVHLFMHLTEQDLYEPDHGPTFAALGKLVCDEHGFDPKLFV